MPSDEGRIASQLESARSQVEDRFAKAGAMLESTLDVVGRLIDSLDTLAGAIDADAVGKTTSELLSTAAHLNALPQNHAARQEHLLGLRASAANLRAHIDDMRQSMKYLRVFALNVKVTAAATAQSAAVFAGFAEEMFSRIDMGVHELTQFSQQIDDLEVQLATALDFEQNLNTQCGFMLPAVPDRLSVDASAVGEHHRQVAGAANKVATLARRVQMKVASALSALQIGDITRQRIEHIQSGLAMVEAAPRQASDEAAQRLKRAVLHMLAAQMADTAEDFRREAGRMTKNLSSMAADTAEILSLQDFAASGDGGGLRGLEVSVGQAMTLVGDVAAATDNADQVGQSTSLTVEGLVQRVGAIRMVKDEIQRMAVNTSLRCSRLGDVGKPLNVIAHELGVYSGRLEDSAGLTLGALNTLGEGAAQMAERRERDRAEGGMSNAGEMLAGAVGRLRAAADVVDKDLAGLAGQGQRVATSLSDMTRRLNLQQDLGDVLDGASRALVKLAGQPVEARADIAPALDAIMADIAGLYTMARERTVHAEHAGLAPPAKAEDALEDALF